MIKFLSLLIVITLSSKEVISQTEFAPIGSKWFVNESYSIEEGQKPLESFRVYESEKDTLIDNLNFRKINSWLFTQIENKVFYRYNDTIRLIYDFGIQEKDTIEFEMLDCIGNVVPTKFVVNKIDSINFGNETLKRFECNSLNQYLEYNNQKYTYLEKLGSERYLVENLVNCAFVPGAEPDILRCYHENNIEYKTEWFKKFGQPNCDIITSFNDLEIEKNLKVYPNPSLKDITVEINNPESSILEIININGQTRDIKINGQKLIHTEITESGLYLVVSKNNDGNILAMKKVIIN